MPCNDSSGAQVRIDLAFRRLQLALLRSGYEFDGETLESAVKRAARIVEDRGDRDDFLADCDRVDSREHWWTEWQSNVLNALREDRFCFRCGVMETQEFRPDAHHGHVGHSIAESCIPQCPLYEAPHDPLPGNLASSEGE